MKFFDILSQRNRVLLKLEANNYGTNSFVKTIQEQNIYGFNVKTFRLINGIIQEISRDNYTQILIKEMEAEAETETEDDSVEEGQRNVTTHKEEEYKIVKTRLKMKSDLLKLVYMVNFCALKG